MTSDYQYEGDGDVSDLRPMPPSLRSALSNVPIDVRVAFLNHLAEGTSCDYLSDWLRRAGHPVSATTLKRYRAGLQ